ncbi:MAG: hypothetical protein RIG27_12025 [Coleofasciculus sp. F4-SAH-05]
MRTLYKDKECNCMTLQATLKRVDYAFNRWFKGLAKRPKYKSIKHYSGWTYPSKTGWKVHTTGDNGYLDLAACSKRCLHFWHASCLLRTEIISATFQLRLAILVILTSQRIS